MSQPTPKNLANLIWQVADRLRGDYKRADCFPPGSTGVPDTQASAPVLAD